jgi:hypothetical protein
MGRDEKALFRLWNEKRGEAEPEDLSGNLIAQLGAVTEDLNRSWYERNSGHRVIHVQRRVQLPLCTAVHAPLRTVHRREGGGSSGLDVVRKILGRHEIATIQTTAVDSAAGMVTLTTTLAHGSGEWVASDWPVCSVAETANPQRMGAALTYARRYALFTLVGIAGEDDLDAPDLEIATSASVATAGKPDSVNDRTRPSSWGQRSAAAHQPLLAPDESARLREGIFAEIESMASSAAAVAWATTMLPSKNSLTAEDARAVEAAFEVKFAEWANKLAPEEPAPHVGCAGSSTIDIEIGTAEIPSADPGFSERRLSVTKTVRHRSKDHLRFVRGQPCLICAKRPSDAHHLRFAQPRALGRKMDGEYTVPLCRAHHREVHRATRELAWWQSRGIAPLAIAAALWQKTRSGEVFTELPGPPKSSRGPTRPPVMATPDGE